MSEAVAFPLYQRPNARDLTDMHMPMLDGIRARACLSAQQLGVWFSLRLHLWEYGELPPPTTPANIKFLAGLGGVTVRTFRNFMSALVPHFDVDEHYRWHLRDMDVERNRRLDLRPDERVPSAELLPPPEQREIDPVKSRSGTAGGKASGAARREKRDLRLLQGGREGNLAPSDLSPDDASLITEGGDAPSPIEAEGEAKNEANSGGIEAAEEAAGEANGEAPASVATNQPTHSDLKLKQEPNGGLVGRERANSPGQSEAPGEANGGSKAEADASGNPPTASPTQLGDVAIVDAVVRACGGKVKKGEAYRFLPAYRRDVAPEVDFFEDVVPVLKRFAGRMPRVDNWACKPILDDARDRALSRRAAAASGSPAGGRQVRIYKGTPEGDAYLARVGHGVKNPFPAEDGERRYRVEIVPGPD